MFRVAFILLASIMSAALFPACTKLSDAPTDKGPKRELPLAEYHDTTILDMYEGSHLSWVLKTMHLVKWPRTDLVRAKPVDLVVYDSLGKTLVHVTADSGSVDEAISFLVASGHVHGHSEKGVDIKSDSLRWNKAINQISTEARVRVVSEDGDVLTGKGFLSDAKLDNWQILSDVKGVFQKVEERFQKADADSAKVGGRPADSTQAPVGNGSSAIPPKPGDALKPAVPATPAVPVTPAPKPADPVIPATPAAPAAGATSAPGSAK